MTEVQWQLAGRPYDALQSLAAFGQAQQGAMREQQFRNAQMDRAREAEGRDALGALLRAGRASSSGAVPMAPGLRGVIDAGANAAGGQRVGSSIARPNFDVSRDEAFDRLTRTDPERAARFEAQERQATKEQLAIFQDINARAMQLMGGVTDQASYDLAKRRGQALFSRYGLSLDEYQLPDQYSPEVVRGLMMQALDTDKQLSQLRQDRRLDADIADDEADNARADLNTESMIEDRAARRGLVARGQDMADSRGRYGISVASRDRQRGQDISSADRRRGQDMTDRRAREGGGGRKPAGGGKTYARIAEDGNGNRVGWNGKAWVPIK